MSAQTNFPFPTTHPLINEARFAVDAVRRAALLAVQIQGQLDGAKLNKPDSSPVTMADFAIQACMGKLLQDQFPDDVLVGEESATALRSPTGDTMRGAVTEWVRRWPSDSEFKFASARPEQVCDWIDFGQAEPGRRFWMLDPIDGTKGFLRGQQYAVALALMVDQEVQLGVLGCPCLTQARFQDSQGPGSLMVALKGAGVFTAPLHGEMVFTALKTSLRSQAAELQGLRSVESSRSSIEKYDAILNRIGATKAPILMDSLAKYAVVASGMADLVLRLVSPRSTRKGEYIWDVAPGALMVTEAGGQVTDLDGHALDYSAGKILTHNRGVVASNGKIHAQLLAAIKDEVA